MKHSRPGVPVAEQLTLAEDRTASGRKSRRNTGTTEDDLIRSVRKIAGYTGYLVYHTRWSKGSEPGFPDVVLVNANRRRLIFAELKTATGKTTPAQNLWLASLRAAGAEAYLWRPADLAAIAALLQGSTTPQPVEGGDDPIPLARALADARDTNRLLQRQLDRARAELRALTDLADRRTPHTAAEGN
jgi:hypothetical protein